ncbi:MAG TPA: hypothetical protein VFX59_24910 [Polyangiales bacterium]|nr:hypothetical protein [Polyangiales bacterium]
MNKTIAILVLLLGASACSDDFDPGSLVTKTRVLAVQADTPFALPGQEVHLSALVYDPEDRALTWAWGECEAVESTAAVDCLRQTSFESLKIGPDLTTHTLTVPNVSTRYAGVVVIACPGTVEAGTTQTIPIVCRDAAGNALPLSEFEIGLKRIFLRDSSLNMNPQIDGLTIAGVDWSADLVPSALCKDDACSEFADQEIVVRADGASEQSVDAAGLPIKEQSVIQFYATGGEFEDDFKLASAGDMKWHAKREDAGKRIEFWFVVRDDRGGVSWIERSLQVP